MCGLRFITTEGPFRINLLPHAAPKHVANIMYLAELGFYEGMAFQFLKPGERIQTGCPIGNGSGTPGYTFAGEYDSGLKHDRAGLLSMANAGKNSDGCQFFVTLRPMPWMDGRHTIFGEVTEGMATVEAIGKAGTKLGVPREKVVITDAGVQQGLPLTGT